MYINQKRGKIGENLACKYLEKNQYTIVERNFRCRQGELDIIACDGKRKELVFLEVKTRSNLKYGRPSEAVNKKKKEHMVAAAKYYYYKNKIHKIPIRFDVIEVFLNNSNYKINHIRKVF